MKRCYMIHEPAVRDGGGNVLSETMVTVKRTAALGDVLSASVVADKLSEKGFRVRFQAHSSAHCLLRRLPSINDITEPGGFCHVDLDGAYENDPLRTRKHFHGMFLERANEQLQARGVHLGEARNCKPKMRVEENEKAVARMVFQNYERPWTFICPRSQTYNVRQVPDGIWEQAAKGMPGTKFWLGMHPAPAGIVDLNVKHVDNLIVWLSVADLLVSVDTGPLHIGAALGIPIVAINQSSSPEQHLSNQCDFVSISPGGLDCLNCQKNMCPKNQWTPPCQNIDPNLISAWATARLRGLESESVSAVIPIYRPPAERLNRCIEAVRNQVSEVIVASDLAGQVPQGAMQGDKIRYVRMNLHDTGYGRKQTFGNRHSNSKYILHLNDDCYVQPDTVAKLKEQMAPDVGLVACLLKYPDGRIQHAGTVRAPGQRGWHHLDQGKWDWTIKQPVEMENVTGACVLTRRKPFFDVNGFCELHYLCGEDNDLGLKLRRAGWKIIYTPLTWATHEESVSTRTTPNFIQHIQHSNALIEQKWGKYFDHNANRVPLGNFNY